MILRVGKSMDADDVAEFGRLKKASFQHRRRIRLKEIIEERGVPPDEATFKAGMVEAGYTKSTASSRDARKRVRAFVLPDWDACS